MNKETAYETWMRQRPAIVARRLNRAQRRHMIEWFRARRTAVAMRRAAWL